MDKNEMTYNFFINRKSVKISIQSFIEQFEAVYKTTETKGRELLGQCIQQMFRKYYFSELIPDTDITPANIINTFMEREFGKDVMCMPLLEVRRKNKKLQNIGWSTISFSSEDHYFIKDMEKFIKFADEGVLLTGPGIIPDDSRENLGENITINDRHYINIISMLAKSMGLLEQTSLASGTLWKTSDKASEFLSLQNKDKLNVVIKSSIKLCSQSIIEEFPQLKEEFSEERMENLLKIPRDFTEIFTNVFKKLGINLTKMSKQMLEMDYESIPELSQKEISKMYDLYNIQALFDMFFTVPFGYYLQLIQPIYPEVYDIDFESTKILQYIDNLQAARTSLFGPAYFYDLTLLGEEMLLNGKRSKRKHDISEDVDDDVLYQAIMELKEYLDFNEDEDDCEVIDINDYLNITRSNKHGKGKNKNASASNKNKANPQLDKKVFVFKAKLYYSKRIWRQIEIKGNQALHDLHEWIYSCFGLESGHLYSFFMSNKAWDSESEYSHPQADGRSAAKVKISSLNLSLKQKFMYIYDYGDEHRFEIELIDIKDVEDGAKYPRMVKKNKPSVTVCDECKSSEKPVEWFCCDHEVYLCEKCAQSKKRDDCYVTNAIV